MNIVITRDIKYRLSALTKMVLGVVAISIYSAGHGYALVAGKMAVELVPHRAIYDMKLNKAKSGAGVAGIRGRMVFEFSGSTCEGYTLNMRLVTRIIDQDGRNTTTDLRSSTWERGDGQKFRFNSTQYHDQRLYEVTTGDALRLGENANIQVKLRKPQITELKLPASVMFPTQHSRAILKAAFNGEQILQASVYDGSEKGQRLFNTTTFIGKSILPGAKARLKDLPNVDSLKNLPSWPVSISYFDAEKQSGEDGEVVPSYELSLRLYANGVSRKLNIDYGDFSIVGTLSSIDFLKTTKCGN